LNELTLLQRPFREELALRGYTSKKCSVTRIEEPLMGLTLSWVKMLKTSLLLCMVNYSCARVAAISCSPLVAAIRTRIGRALGQRQARHRARNSGVARIARVSSDSISNALRRHKLFADWKCVTLFQSRFCYCNFIQRRIGIRKY